MAAEPFRWRDVVRISTFRLSAMLGAVFVTAVIAMLGVALLVLARLEPGHPHISDWGWSHVTLALGLTLGVALAPPDLNSLHYQGQATVATACGTSASPAAAGERPKALCRWMLSR